MSKSVRLTKEEVLDRWRDDKICHMALDEWAARMIENDSCASSLIAGEVLIRVLKSRLGHHEVQEVEVGEGQCPPFDEL